MVGDERCENAGMSLAIIVPGAADAVLQIIEPDAEDFEACLPGEAGIWPENWTGKVDTYIDKHGGTRASLFREIVSITGNSVTSLYMRYRDTKLRKLKVDYSYQLPRTERGSKTTEESLAFHRQRERIDDPTRLCNGS